jgi:hypothetical protein
MCPAGVPSAPAGHFIFPLEDSNMDQTKTYTLVEAHQYFAKYLNSRVWELLQLSVRSQNEDDEMLHAAHACTRSGIRKGNVSFTGYRIIA